MAEDGARTTVLPLLCGFFFLAFSSIAQGQAVPAEEGGLIQLGDSNFEHDTQAATGQTTGRWLVLFTAPKCESCKQVEDSLLELAQQNSAGALLAKVDVSMNPALAKRFNISAVPSIRYFRDRKMFACKDCSASASAIGAFIQEGYRERPALEVPPEPPALNVLLTQLLHIYTHAAEFLALRPTLLACVGGVVAVGCYALTRHFLGLDKRVARKRVSRTRRKAD